MKKHVLTLSAVLAVLFRLEAQQLSAPNVEAVYGGRIIAITGYDKGTDTTRLFVATESANSVFYADVVTHAGSSSTTYFPAFTVVPALNNSANYGGGLSNIAAHATSGNVYFSYADKLMSTNPASSTVNTVSTGGMHTACITGNYLFYVRQAGPTTFNYGTLSASGAFTASATAITVSVNGPCAIAVNPVNNKVYLFVHGNMSTGPKLYRSSDVYTALSPATTFTDISPVLAAGVEWKGFGIAPDGRVFIGGSNGTNKYAAHTDNDTTWSSATMNIAGVSGTRFAFSGTGSNYITYFATAYNTHHGDSGYWTLYGTPGGFETHSNDGDVYVDPNDSNVVYLTTDQGLGASVDGGSTIFEIDEGIEAVQVNDFDMTTDKNTAWIASKAGIRKVSNYLASKVWTAAMFPNGDGSPYYSAEMQNNDTNTVYVGNLRVYKTTNGSTWSQVFSPEGAPYNYPSVGTRVEAIEVCDYDPNTVFAGYYIDGSTRGGLFYSTNAGSSWNIIRLHATSGYNDVDVWDIVFNKEGSDTVAYVSVAYDTTAPGGYSVYRLVKSGSTWTPAQNMSSANTSTGTVIVATLRDLHKSITGDTLYACGTDVGVNHPVAYFKPITATNKWTPVNPSGFPMVTGKQGYAITLGVDTIYCAVENEIYMYPLSGSTWSLGYSYPVGTQINFLYYDELLAGTGTGLYGHTGPVGPVGMAELADQTGNLLCFPNPSNGSFRLRFKVDRVGKADISLFDISGRKVMSMEKAYTSIGTTEDVCQVTGLHPGIYFLKLTQQQSSATIRVTIVD